MSKTHSPGPWRVGKKQERAILDANGSQIAVIPDSLKPDAALIAAAPEMLDALKHASSILGRLYHNIQLDTGDTAIAYQLISLAIAKAEGNVKTETE